MRSPFGWCHDTRSVSIRQYAVSRHLEHAACLGGLEHVLAIETQVCSEGEREAPALGCHQKDTLGILRISAIVITSIASS